ncbi:hypothetical protein DXG03_002363 [Asterophora parasitica]|uniref:F-box domain-containing protein n=1 Tax=Asterophora parasitica TaxID=117018 RepID=A0A9P7G3Y5_9AGAR|nr:hypothetical protein DXG03_002363 [Asterophora parasitica]
MQALQSTLEILSVDIIPLVSSPPGFIAFTNSLLHHRCLPTLRSLTIRASKWNTVLTAPEFRGLFVLHALEVLHISNITSHELDDTCIADAAPSWPSLEQFHIEAPEDIGPTSIPPNVTLAGLIPLIRHCPELNSFSIPIHAKPFDVNLLQPGDRNMTIEYLHFEASTIEAPAAVYRRLLLMFPKLEWIVTHHLLANDDEEGWGYIREVLQESTDSWDSDYDH